VSGSLESSGCLTLEYVLRGDLARARLPTDGSSEAQNGVRRDELWRRTCVELFARGDDAPGYLEFNFSPDGDWAAYGFDSYRAGRRDIDVLDLRTHRQHHRDELHLRCSLRVPLMAATAGVKTWHLGFAAIVEDDTGAQSYWALHHPRAQPDFHDPTAFRCTLWVWPA
jgi:hypothetical protein